MYDYIIVGAGSAGCVLAARLSENPATRVLLLEAGPPDDADEIHIPAALNLLFQSTYDWDYRTVPQERAAGRAIYWPRGRMLGGSSSMNAMIYIRGARHDYDTWRDEYGCTGWGYTDLMPYFRRAEDNTRGASAYHGEGGPLTVSDLKYRSALTKAWVASARACGLGENEDFNGPQQDGSGFYQVTQRDGRRWSAADAYLHRVSSQPNLTVLTDARATQVVVEAGRAAGVRYLLRGTEEMARAEAEVILAAGAIGSPHLLMLSGIGPADHLHEHGLIVHVDNPAVGANLSDHPVVTAMWDTPRTAGLWEESTPGNLARWRLRHSGPLTSNVAEAGGFTRTRPSLPAPDLQWHALPTPYQREGLADPKIRGRVHRQGDASGLCAAPPRGPSPSTGSARARAKGLASRAPPRPAAMMRRPAAPAARASKPAVASRESIGGHRRSSSASSRAPPTSPGIAPATASIASRESARTSQSSSPASGTTLNASPLRSTVGTAVSRSGPEGSCRAATASAAALRARSAFAPASGAEPEWAARPVALTRIVPAPFRFTTTPSSPSASWPASKHKHASQPAKRSTWTNGDVRHSSSPTSRSAISA